MATRSTAKRTSAKRDTVRARTATMYAKRDQGGEFREMDRSSKTRKTAKTSTRSTAKSRRGGGAR